DRSGHPMRLSPPVSAGVPPLPLPAPESPDPAPPMEAGTTAPDIKVYDRLGNPVRLSSFKGQVVVLDFWATWCGPCQESMPPTNEVARKFKPQGVVVLAVNVWDTKAEFDKWVAAHKEYESILFAIDPGTSHAKDAATMYKVSGIPAQFVIGK